MPDHSACGPCGECIASACIKDLDCIVVAGGCASAGAGRAAPPAVLLLCLHLLLSRRKPV